MISIAVAVAEAAAAPVDIEVECCLVGPVVGDAVEDDTVNVQRWRP